MLVLTDYYRCLISVNGMEAMWQAWREDKEAVFHARFCRSTNGFQTVF